MNLVEKAKKSARENGKRVNAEVVKGLEAIQTMHELCKKVKGSPYKTYILQKKQEK
jgi:hypothetical protein